MERKRASIGLFATHGLADNISTVVPFMLGFSYLEGNPIYSAIYSGALSTVGEIGLSGTTAVVVGAIATAVVGVGAVGVGAGLLYRGWDDLEGVPGFDYWLRAMLAIGVLVPASNVLIFVLHVSGHY